MRHFLTLLVCFVTISSVHAGVLEMDLAAPGDGLLTYDTINKRTWLDLPETGGLELSEVLEQMEPGGRLAGFQFAMLEDVTALAASAQVGWTNPTLPGVQSDAAGRLIDLVDWTIHYTGGIVGNLKMSVGLITQGFLNGEPQFDGTTFCINVTYQGEDLLPGQINTPIFYNPKPHGGVYVSGPVSFIMNPSFWLYRTVPEPSSVLLLGIAAICTSRRRERIAA